VIQKRELGAHGVEELCPLGVVGKLELQGGLWVSMLPGSVVLISRGMLYSGGRKHHQIVAMSDGGGWSGHAGDNRVGARHGIVVGEIGGGAGGGIGRLIGDLREWRAHGRAMRWRGYAACGVLRVAP